MDANFESREILQCLRACGLMKVPPLDTLTSPIYPRPCYGMEGFRALRRMTGKTVAATDFAHTSCVGYALAAYIAGDMPSKWLIDVCCNYSWHFATSDSPKGSRSTFGVSAEGLTKLYGNFGLRFKRLGKGKERDSFPCHCILYIMSLLPSGGGHVSGRAKGVLYDPAYPFEKQRWATILGYFA